MQAPTIKQANPGEHKVFIIYRALAKPITPLVYKTGLTANQITIGRALVCVPLSMIFFYYNSYLTNLIAILFYHTFKLFDVIDGEIARLRGMSSHAGHWLDSIIDFVGDGFIIAGVTASAVSSCYTKLPWALAPYLSKDLVLAAGLLAIFSFSGNYLLFEQIENRFKAFSNQNMILRRFEDSQDASKRDRIVRGLLFLPSMSWRMVFSVGYIFTVAVLLDQIIVALILISMAQLLRLFTLINVHFKILGKHEERGDLVVRLVKETLPPVQTRGTDLDSQRRRETPH